MKPPITNRRKMLQLAAVGSAIAHSGCTEYVHRARGVNTSVRLRISNQTDDTRSITVRIDRDGSTVLESSFELDEQHTITSIDGDDPRDAEFRTAGEYTVFVEEAEEEERSTIPIRWKHLADCNFHTVYVSVDEDGFRIGRERTDKGCSGLDRLGSAGAAPRHH